MADAFTYEQKVLQLDHQGLLTLWQAILTGHTPEWSLGKALEYLVLRAFQLEEADVRWPYSVSLEGEEIEQIDGVVYSDGFACLIECKDLAERANIEPIAKLRNQPLQRPAATIGVVVSRSGFTEPAVTLARFVAPQTILLWGGDELQYTLEQKAMRRALLAKYRYCVERGLPFYDIRNENIP